MVRNSKRRAFTIVELVIVIAVIAILAAVMIPTFGGVIESANVSADKQILSTVNSQIAIYTGLGNKIETEADLWKALEGGFNGGSNMTEKFDPRSAKNGYHYWYNATAQKVELLQYNKDTKFANVSTGKMMIVRATSVAQSEGEAFAEASPRAFAATADEKENFYFLDKGNANEFSGFFAVIENLSTTNESNYKKLYDDALDAVTKANKANKDLADALVARMAATAILTNKPAIVGGAETITHIYIPENNNKQDDGKTPTDDYYLNHQGTSGITTNVSATIVVPENIKLGDGCLDAFNDVTVRVDVDIEDVAGVISAGAVSANATVQIGGNNYTIDGNVVTNKDTGEKLETKLLYKNPVTEKFKVSVQEGFADNNYIALHKMQEAGFKLIIKNTEALTGVNNEATYVPFCQDLIWTVVEGADYVTITNNGELTIKENANLANASTITLKATPVAVNSEEDALAAEITLTVVKLNEVRFEFDGSTINLANKATTLLVGYGESVGFSGFTSTYVVNGTEKVVDGLNVDKLGAPSFTIAANENNEHITIVADGEAYNVNFNKDKVKATILSKGFVSENVTIKVDNITNTYEVKIEPVLFTSAIPSYKEKTNFTSTIGADGNRVYEKHVYNIGNANSITLGRLFELTDLFEGETVTNVKVQTWYATGESEGGPAGASEIKNNSIVTEGKTDWTEYEITLTNTTTNWISVSNGAELAYIKVKVVDGALNIYDEASFINKDYNAKDKDGKETNVALAGTDTQSIVLHSDLTFTGYSSGNGGCLRIMKDATIYGNYYIISAPDFRDADSNTKNGHSLFYTSGTCTFNQVIIDGPVYHRSALSASNQGISKLDVETNPNGFFAYGIMANGNTEINDSYISGFNSTVRITGTFTANNTIFDGGAWSNIFIASSENVTLTDCETIQSGYESTKFDGVSGQVKGMGIYIHGETQQANAGLQLTLNNTKQYNYISEAEKDSYDAIFGMAIGEIFTDKLPDFYKHGSYVNAGIISLGIEVRWTILANIEMTYPFYGGDKITVNGTTGSTYRTTYNDDGTTKPLVGGAYTDNKYTGLQGYRITSQVYSNTHNEAGCACAEYADVACSAKIFRADKVK